VGRKGRFHDIWGTGFVVANWVYFALTPDGVPARKWLIGTLVTVWGLRLSLYLLWRNRGKGEDFRYRKWREEAGGKWAYYLIAAAGGGWWTVFSPVLMTTLLLRVSGVALLEKTLTTAKPGYKEYVESTSAFIPWFSRRRRLQ